MINLLDTFLLFVALACIIWLLIAWHDYHTLKGEQHIARRDWDAHEHRYYHRR